MEEQYPELRESSHLDRDTYLTELRIAALFWEKRHAYHHPPDSAIARLVQAELPRTKRPAWRKVIEIAYRRENAIKDAYRHEHRISPHTTHEEE